MARVKLSWSPRAKQALREIRQYIARDSPKTAKAFTDRLTRAAARLRDIPQMGAAVPEFDDPEILEIYHGSYRIIYRFRASTVRILTVFHGARILHPESLSD